MTAPAPASSPDASASSADQGLRLRWRQASPTRAHRRSCTWFPRHGTAAATAGADGQAVRAARQPGWRMATRRRVSAQEELPMSTTRHSRWRAAGTALPWLQDGAGRSSAQVSGAGGSAARAARADSGNSGTRRLAGWGTPRLGRPRVGTGGRGPGYRPTSTRRISADVDAPDISRRRRGCRDARARHRVAVR